MLLGSRFKQSLLTHTRLWYLINAKDQINGRLAAYIATILQGKTKPIWHPKADVGDFVVVVNTRDIVFTGKKWDRKVYRHHTGIVSNDIPRCPPITLGADDIKGVGQVVQTNGFGKALYSKHLAWFV